MSKQHPIQPLEYDEHGVLRFKSNVIVKYLLDNGGIDMNQLAVLDFPQEDREQFLQLIGYSHSGYECLSHTSEESSRAAMQMFTADVGEIHARNTALRNQLASVRVGLRGILPLIEQLDLE